MEQATVLRVIVINYVWHHCEGSVKQRHRTWKDPDLLSAYVLSFPPFSRLLNLTPSVLLHDFRNELWPPTYWTCPRASASHLGFTQIHRVICINTPSKPLSTFQMILPGRCSSRALIKTNRPQSLELCPMIALRLFFMMYSKIHNLRYYQRMVLSLENSSFAMINTGRAISWAGMCYARTGQSRSQLLGSCKLDPSPPLGLRPSLVVGFESIL